MSAAPSPLRALLAVLAAASALAGCVAGTTSIPTPIPRDLRSPYTGYVSAKYGDPARWLCVPGRADTCAQDLSATEIHADGSRTLLHAEVARDAKVDCFYVYPTVDDRMFVAKNHEDLSDVKAVEFATSAQAAQLGQVCSLYVPLYRQVTLGTYFRDAGQREAGLAVAFSDIEDAFLHYLSTFNHGRKIVLVGHSQGAEMVKRLLLRFFDGDPSMRERLLLAIPVGGELDVAQGKTTGGTFANLPTCSREDEEGCIVAYRSGREWSHGVSMQDVDPGREAMCVNPGNLASSHERAALQAYFPRFERLLGQEKVTTPFVFYRDLYSARCVDGKDGKRVLEIAENDEPGGLRQPPVDLSSWKWGLRMGTHMLDMQIAQGNLVDLIRKRTTHLR